MNESGAASTTASERSVGVWDVPTRIFHWALVVLVTLAWFTGEGEGVGALTHRLAGEIIAGMLAFRLIWGFVGGEHARFADFAAGPNLIVAHMRNVFSKQPQRHLGHNPLGGVAVFLLLLVTSAIVVTGLFSAHDGMGGPFAAYGGEDVAELHEVAFRVLQGLVVLHVLGVVVESWISKDALAPAMITGVKKRRAGEPGIDARRASTGTLILALAVGFAVSATLIALNPPSGAGEIEDHGERDHR